MGTVVCCRDLVGMVKLGIIRSSGILVSWCTRVRVRGVGRAIGLFLVFDRFVYVMMWLLGCRFGLVVGVFRRLVVCWYLIVWMLCGVFRGLWLVS